MGKTVPGTRSYHHYTPISTTEISYKRTSEHEFEQHFNLSKAVQVINDDAPLPNLNYFVACRYDTFWWVGIVDEIEAEKKDFKIKFMHPHGPSKRVSWPERDDSCWVPINNMIAVIGVPTTRSGRIYEIDIDDFNKVHKLNFLFIFLFSTEHGSTVMEGDEICSHKYPFKLTKIMRLPHDHPDVKRLISENKPVVIEGTHLVSSALKWDIPHLKKNIGNDNFTVFSSNNHKFRYYDGAKIDNVEEKFSPPYCKNQMKFSEFAEKIRTWKPGDQWIYFQTPLSSTIGPSIVRDFLSFNWSWVNNQQQEQHWGPLSSNLLLIGPQKTVTPVHYDEQENFFAQLYGKKRCILFSPDKFECLYPYPVFHPHDRQSQVDFDDPDFSRFPKFRDLIGYEATVKPGDVLYIPMYWWHYIESLCDTSYTVSINFWYKSSVKSKIEYPLSGQQKVAIMRNVEKILLDALESPKEVSQLLQTLVSGRFT
ncbi:Hypoxia-inducible factor 1-alpha inhibitor [Nymphon striatum]|nr:Hypoxia-inducible factor 1-alpha inhibitor [Nymphon striatum]